jgi:signal transduction histidine kinase
MASARNNGVELERNSGPGAQFANDLARLITDIDHLIIDVGKPMDTERMLGKPNGRNGKSADLTYTITKLQQHARMFARLLEDQDAAQDRLPIPCLELDDKARIVRTNAEFDALFSRTKPLVGMPLSSLVARADLDAFRAHLAVSRRGRAPVIVRLSADRTGKGIPVALRIRRQVINGVTGYMAVAIPKTEESQVRRQAFSDPFVNFLMDLNQADSVASVSGALGTYCAKAFRSPAGMIISEQDGERQLAAHWPPRLMSKKPLIDEMMNAAAVSKALDHAGPVFWSQSSNNPFFRLLRRMLPGKAAPAVAFWPLRPSAQEAVAVLVMVLDEPKLTRDALDDLNRVGHIASVGIVRSRAYEAAHAARLAAERANQQKEESISILSHELKEPLTPLLGWAVAMSSGALTEERQGLAIESIVRNVKALNYLINDLVDVTRLSSGKVRLEFVQMRIQDVVREALNVVQPMAETKKLRISTDMSEGIGPIHADSRRIRQVLINLLNNAVKFTPAGGSIRMKVARRDSFVECAVSDTGKGIASNFLPHVFERFQQEKRSSNEAVGLGLGLAIAREIIELHGGTIKAHSHGPNQGATFTFRLPMRKSKRAFAASLN